MIISHRYKFIFVKTRKVAGSSIELRLSRLLQEGDIASPLQEREDDPSFDLSGVTIKKFHGFGTFGRPFFFSSHSPLARMYRKYGNKIADYKVVTVERNPWDRTVSQFFWSKRSTDIKTRPPEEQVAEFKSFILKYGTNTPLNRIYGRRKQRALSQKNLYCLGSTPMPDFMIRFEALEDDLARLSEFLGLDETLSIRDINAKGEHRAKKSRDYRRFFDDETKALVEKNCAWEIKNLGYGFAPSIPPVFEPDPNRHAAREEFLRKHTRHGR